MLHKFIGKITYCAKTDQGLCRNINQDAIAVFTKDNLGLFVLSDGMGGHSRGELASREAALAFSSFWEYLTKLPELPDFMTLTNMIQQVVMSANQKIFTQYNQGQICGATIVVLLVMNDCYAVFSVGDSRIYTYAKKQLMVLTVDDIWDNLPDTVNNYTKEEIAANERSGRLVQAVGTGTELNIHVSTNRLIKGQVFLLCSDGLFKFCEEEWLRKCLRSVKSEESMKKAVDDCLKKVYDHGAGDNVSMILVRVI